MPRPRPKIKKIGRGKNCLFCKENIIPDYKDAEVLSKFISERARILSAVKTGVCASHQRQLSRAIKRARFLALLPFVHKIT